MLDAGSFSDKRVVEKSKKFVRVMVNCTAPGKSFEQTAEGRTLMARYNVKGWPTVVFLAPNGVVTDRFTSCKKPPFVLQKMDDALRAANPAKRKEQLLDDAQGSWLRVRTLVAKLSHDDATERQKAMEELQRLRELLDVALAGAQKSDDPEKRRRAKATK